MIKFYGAKVFTWVGLMGVALVLTACGPDKPLHMDPCRPSACGVPVPASSPMSDPASEYVPLCEDAGLTGPCVMMDDTTVLNAWWYVGAGAQYPAGRVQVAGCVVETGGPVPCAWVPSAMGEHPTTGDMGAYVYR
jgi:hypothetical protein